MSAPSTKAPGAPEPSHVDLLVGDLLRAEADFDGGKFAGKNEPELEFPLLWRRIAMTEAENLREIESKLFLVLRAALQHDELAEEVVGWGPVVTISMLASALCDLREIDLKSSATQSAGAAS